MIGLGQSEGLVGEAGGRSGAPLRALAWLAAGFLAAAPAAAQVAEIRGTVSAAAGGPLVTADVQLRAAADSGLVGERETGPDGTFRFAGLRSGRYRLTVELLGYARKDTTVNAATGVQVVAIVLQERAIDLPSVRVEAERVRARFEEEAGATVSGLRLEQMKLIPGVAEADVLRSVEVLPGVVSTSDYSSAFNVRGGSADQNLILLDGFPVFNPFHLGGLFSVFNADMVGRADLLSGGFPAEYGGRVSSVLTIESAAGESGLNGQAGMSLLATRLAVGTSLPQDAAVRLGLESARGRLSLRRSYFDQVLSPFFDFPYHLTDLQAFGEAWTAGGTRWLFTGYSGRDVLNLAGLEDFPLQVRWNWGNDVAGIGMTRPLGSGGRLDSRFGYSHFATAIRFPEFQDTDFRSEVSHLLLRADLAQPLGAAAGLRFGLEAGRMTHDNLAMTGGTVFRRGQERGWLLGGYGEGNVRAGGWLLEGGVRLDRWAPASRDALLELSPRLALKRFLGGGNFAVKLAAGRYTQFLHSLRDEEFPLGIDVWELTGARAPVVVSNQLQGGVEGFLAGEWQLALEGYHRWFDGVTTNNVADDPNDPLDDLSTGTGRSYGADLLVRRDAGRVRPMLAVSWLRARRTFPDVLSGEAVAPPLTYPPVFDRRLDVDLTVNADVGRGVQVGGRFNYGSGLPYTRAVGAYVYQSFQPLDGTRQATGAGGDDDELAVALGPRNTERYPAYLRLDLGVRKRYEKRWGTLTPYLDVLNVTNRRNVLFYFYEYGHGKATRAGISMFPLLPSIGLEASF
jgi:hypothetical protein